MLEEYQFRNTSATQTFDPYSTENMFLKSVTFSNLKDTKVALLIQGLMSRYYVEDREAGEEPSRLSAGGGTWFLKKWMKTNFL